MLSISVNVSVLYIRLLIALLITCSSVRIRKFNYNFIAMCCIGS